ncbi:MAG: hypothetical protein AAF919_04135 [Pseudomonadota bacterium]
MKRLTLVAALMAFPVAADTVSPSGRSVDCYCTDSTGGRVEMGQRACLTVGGRMFMATCDMSLNSPIWRDTGESCLTG